MPIHFGTPTRRSRQRAAAPPASSSGTEPDHIGTARRVLSRDGVLSGRRPGRGPRAASVWAGGASAVPHRVQQVPHRAGQSPGCPPGRAACTGLRRWPSRRASPPGARSTPSQPETAFFLPAPTAQVAAARDTRTAGGPRLAASARSASSASTMGSSSPAHTTTIRPAPRSPPGPLDPAPGRQALSGSRPAAHRCRGQAVARESRQWCRTAASIASSSPGPGIPQRADRQPHPGPPSPSISTSPQVRHALPEHHLGSDLVHRSRDSPRQRLAPGRARPCPSAAAEQSSAPAPGPQGGDVVEAGQQTVLRHPDPLLTEAASAPTAMTSLTANTQVAWPVRRAAA